MKSSSTSSSRTLVGFPWPARAALLALALAAVVRVCLYLVSDALFLIPENDFDQLYLMSEAQYRLSDNPSPKVIVMGTSRLGILTADCIAQEVGVQPNEVANYALAGNSFWRTLAFFRRNPELLSQAEVVVMDVLPYQLYRGHLFTERDELFLRLSTPAERLRVTSPVGRAQALADLVFPAWSERHNPAGWRQGFALLPLDPQERYRRFMETVSTGKVVDWRQEEHEAPAASTPELGRSYAPPPELSEVQVQAVDDIIDLLPDGAILVLAWLPVRDDFAQAFVDDPEMNASYERFKQFITGLRGPKVSTIWLDNIGGCYLGRSGYTDVVHFSDSGIDEVCRILGKAVQDARGRSGR